MKAKQRDFANAVRRAGPALNLFLLTGPDEASAAQAAARIVESFPQPIERIDLTGADVRRDPVRLADEAQSISLFGDARYLLVRGAGEDATAAVENLLENGADRCPIILLLPGGTDKSKIAKLLEPRDDAIVTLFYPPDLREMTGHIRALADASGLRMDGAIAERIARSTGLDFRLAESEVEKLALYLDASPQAPRTADAAALDAIGAVSEDDAIQPLVNVVLGGEAGKLADELDRLREMDINPVAIALALERRAAQLAGFAARLGQRSDVAEFLEGESRAGRLFFKEKAVVTAQLRRWRGDRLARLNQRLIGLHQQLLANHQSAELLLCQSLTEFTRAASRAGRG